MALLGIRLGPLRSDPPVATSRSRVLFDLIERIRDRSRPVPLFMAPAPLCRHQLITKSAQTGAGLEFSGDAGGFGVTGTLHLGELSWRGCTFSGTVYDSPRARSSLFPAFDSPRPTTASPKTQIATAPEASTATSIFATLLWRGWRDAREGIPTASFGQVFNDNRSQTIDSSGYLKLGYSVRFQDANLR